MTLRGLSLRLCVFAAGLCVPALAAIDGTVTNQTTGKPQAGATVALYKLGGAGMEAVDHAKTDAQGKFTINQELQGGPHLLQSVYDGVTYNHMLPPGADSTGLSLDVYNVSKKQPPAVKITHTLVLEPGNGQLSVTELYSLTNEGKVTWNDPDSGTLRFYLPPAAQGNVQVTCTAPQGMAVRRAAEKTGAADTYKVDFAIKPGETRIQLGFAVPFTGGSYQGKLILKEESTRIATPAGVTLKGDNLTALAPEPRSKANIYDLKAQAYDLQIEGTGSLSSASSGCGGMGGGDDQADSGGGPSIEQILPRVNQNAWLIIGLALGVLALGFILLYRSGDPSPLSTGKELNERRRR